MSINKKIKSKKFVIDQLKSLENDGLLHEEYPENKPLKISKIEAMTKLQSKFLENTAESIRMQINKILGVEKGEDEVWILDLDRMKNYKDYFPENNPCNLIVAFNLDERMKNAVEMNLYKAITTICDGSESRLGLGSMISGSDATGVVSSASGYVAENDL